jgi:hypothetical protein
MNDQAPFDSIKQVPGQEALMERKTKGAIQIAVGNELSRGHGLKILNRILH